MASYSYTRGMSEEELQQPPAHIYTKKEKWENWWDYNLRWVLIGIASLALVIYFVLDTWVLKTEIDYQLAIVSPKTISEETLTDISDCLSPYLADVTGDGKVNVTTLSYLVDLVGYTNDINADTDAVIDEINPDPVTSEELDNMTEEELDELKSEIMLEDYSNADSYDYYMEMAGQVQMMSDIELAESIIYIVYEPEKFQQYTEMFAYLDGTMPEDPQNVAWEELAFPLSDCTVLSEEVREKLDGFYLMRRGSETNEKVLAQLDRYEPVWTLLTEGVG